ncbi:type I restriction modification DNA specificity domain protein [Cetobacterium somerae ATCC BAA-474]|uniref:Type I restriction modification DNA specificity domain protein n=1 Tax=Cetobacterium somerae ATCC BAA-474 TaxID=1319815 RepID=U7VE28_9FUSO|nr:restriction endonuclease subunit S [Cetobacterium somerae]ERT69736.1 type I restriction modification DNA specificity domain protein [Cetobacterium somerae ATCC BAA-474]
MKEIKPGYKETPIGILPRDWDVKRLGELLEFKNGINASKEQYGSGIKFINVLDILNNEYITFDKVVGKVNINQETLDKYDVNYGDILFQRSSETREEVGTASVYLDNNPNVTFGGFVIRGKKISDYFPIFLNKVLKNSAVRNQITSKAGGSTRYNVSQEILEGVLIPIPPKEEQEKIAQILMTWDEAIEKQEELIEQEKEFKKGMMQKIFSQKLRFKDENGNDYSEWEEKKLGETISFIVDNRGKTPPFQENGIPLIEVNSIGKKKIDYNIIKKYVSEEVYNNWFRKYLKKNDILFSTVGATGLCSIYDETIKSIIAQNIVGLRFEFQNHIFIFYLLTFEENNVKFKKIQMGAVQPSLKVTQMTEIKFLFPPLPEQEKIANFLSTIDEKIEVLEKKLEELKEQKKGLMQKLLTGEVRV